MFAAAFMSAYFGAQASAKAEAARWATLTPEQRAEELRVREVQALERLARASENTRRDVHHHFFS